MALNSARCSIPLKMKGHRFWGSGQDSAACLPEGGLQVGHECFRHAFSVSVYLKETQVGPNQTVLGAEPDVAL